MERAGYSHGKSESKQYLGMVPLVHTTVADYHDNPASAEKSH